MLAEVSVGGFWHEKFQHKPWSSGIFELKCIHLDTSQEDKDLKDLLHSRISPMAHIQHG